MQKVLIITGPTAIGKSDFAIATAKRFQGEIISADSVQLYRHFDIGSGKLLGTGQAGIVHHLIDILDYDETFSVADFQSVGRKLINEIHQRGHLPIVVGGTGLYIKALLYDYVFTKEQEADDPFNDLSNEELYRQLEKYDPQALVNIHPHNRKRLVRALNIYLKTGEKKSAVIAKQKKELIYDAKLIGLTCERAQLYRRIERRVELMMRQGLEKEVASILEKGASFSAKPMQSIGYRQFEAYFKQTASLEETVALIKKASKNYAKRQYTWFNNQLPLTWYDINALAAATAAIERWLNDGSVS